MTNHPQVTVDYFGYPIKVDEGMVELLQLIWKAGYETNNSCQDNHGNIWIAFDNVYQFHKMVQMAHDYDLKVNDEVWTTDTLKNFLDENVKTVINIGDDGHVEDDEYFPGPNIELHVSIRFPKEKKEEFIRLWRETFNK